MDTKEKRKTQKVITVNVLARAGDKPDYKEMEFEMLNKYLDQGFKVVNTFPIAPSPNLYIVTITFILEKDE